MSSRATRLLVNEAVVLTAASLAGTILAYLHEVAYLEKLGIPVELVQLDLNKCIVATAVVLFSALPLIVSLWFSCSLRPFIRITGFGFAVVFISIVAQHWILATFALVLWVLCGLIAWIARRRGMIISEVDPPNTSEYAVGALMLLFIAILLAINTGGFFGSHCLARHVLADDDSLALVRRYGSDFVFVGFDPKTGVVSERIEIRQTGDGQQLRLIRLANPVLLRK